LDALPYKYLLDTNIISDLIRNPQGKTAKRIAKVGEDKVCTSIIVACELRYGALKKNSAKLTEQLEQVLAPLPILPFEQNADHTYAELRTALELNGTPISANDMLIAAHARACELTLVTANVREFKRISKLKVVNWLAV
jgi:tRNA(fMet)-specific endonuclease VapC